MRDSRHQASVLPQERIANPRQHNAGNVAGQSNADACERRTKKVNSAEHDKAPQHCQPHNQQERRPEKELAVRQRKKTENLSE